MKYLPISIFLLLFATQLKADPWDCMSKAEAERTVAYLIEHPYVVDYCDLCDEPESKHESDRLPAFLMRVSNPRVVPCGWDEERYSVQVDYETLAWGFTNASFEVEEWQAPESIPEDKQPGPVYLDDPRYCVTLNYHWTLKGGKPSRLCFPVEFEMDMPNDGLRSFPASGMIADKQARKAYAKWYKRKMKEK